MLNAFMWGLLATSSLILGGIIASRFSLRKKTLGIIMAFGAGTLISAVSYELIFDSVKLAKGTGFPAFGLFSGALVFFFSDRLIEKMGAKQPYGYWSITSIQSGSTDVAWNYPRWNT